MNKYILVTIIALAIFKQSISLEAETLPGRLPTPRHSLASVYDGDDSVLLLGGIGDSKNYLDEVLQFSLSTGEVQVVGRFPTGIADGSAQLNPDGLGAVYIGGLTKSKGALYSEFSTYVWTSSPNQVNPNPITNLPYPNSRACSARDPNTGFVYEIGGSKGLGDKSHNIFKYNGSSIEIVAALPNELAYCSSTWFNDSIYIFGGYNGLIQPSLDIMKFTPGNDDVVVLPVKLNEDITSGAAVTDGRYIYLIGALFGGSLPFVIYDPINGSQTQEYINNLPIMQNFGAIYTNKTNRIYLFGGLTLIGDDTIYDQIHYINL